MATLPPTIANVIYAYRPFGATLDITLELPVRVRDVDPPDVLVQGVRVHEQQAALVARQLLGGLGGDSIQSGAA